MKVLVCGGSGYIGTVLYPRLIDEGHEITILDPKIPPVPLGPNTSFLPFSILDEDILARVVPVADITVHLAGIVGFPACDANPELAKQVNVDGTELIAKYACGKPVVLASTQSVYGPVEGICTEETFLQPTSLYAQTKMWSEDILFDATPTISLRFSTGFGVSPSMRHDSLINNFTRLAIEIKSLEVFQPQAKRSFIHVQDMARSIVFAIENIDKMLGNAYNVGSESMNLTKIDVATEIERQTGCTVSTIGGEDKEKRDYYVSYDKIRSLGYYTTIGLTEGVEELFSYYEKEVCR